MSFLTSVAVLNVEDADMPVLPLRQVVHHTIVPAKNMPVQINSEPDQPEMADPLKPHLHIPNHTRNNVYKQYLQVLYLQLQCILPIKMHIIG